MQGLTMKKTVGTRMFFGGLVMALLSPIALFFVALEVWAIILAACSLVCSVGQLLMQELRQ